MDWVAHFILLSQNLYQANEYQQLSFDIHLYHTQNYFIEFSFICKKIIIKKVDLRTLLYLIMRKIFGDHLRFRDRPIILKHSLNLNRFTFIQSNLDQQQISISKKAPKAVKAIHDKFKKFKFNLPDLRSYDFTEEDLLQAYSPFGVENSQSVSSVTHQSNSKRLKKKQKWLTNKAILMIMSEQFQIFKKQMTQDLCFQNLKQSMETASTYNLIDITFWQKVFSLISYHYKDCSLQYRLFLIQTVSLYIMKFKANIQNNFKQKYKFLFPQSYINDLCDFKQFIKLTQFQEDYLKQNDSDEIQQIKLQILQSRWFMIKKIGKTTDLNMYWLNQLLEKKKDEMLFICKNGIQSDKHFQMSLIVQHFYAYVNFKDDQLTQKFTELFFQNLELKYMKQNKQIVDLEMQQLSKVINKILAIWKLTRRPSLQMYTKYLRPWIKYLISKEHYVRFYMSIGMNILSSGIQDFELIEEMISIIERLGYNDDHYCHVLKHISNIHSKDKKYESDFQSCTSMQHPSIVHFLEKKNHKTFSTCLKSNQNSESSKRIKGKSMEYHPAEKWWINIIKNLIKDKYQLISNAPFCVYEIDLLIITDKHMIAVEIEGSHYNKNAQSQKTSKIQNEQTGKKVIKKKILNAYGIATLSIICHDPVASMILLKRDTFAGEKYIKNLFKQQLDMKLQGKSRTNIHDRVY